MAAAHFLIEEAIRARAHEIWLSEGCPEGRSGEHWMQAEKEILSLIECGQFDAVIAEADSDHCGI